MISGIRPFQKSPTRIFAISRILQNVASPILSFGRIIG
jgi:hypothetical protein